MSAFSESFAATSATKEASDAIVVAPLKYLLSLESALYVKVPALIFTEPLKSELSPDNTSSPPPDF